MSSYNFEEEYGPDPFKEYTNNAALKEKLTAAIPTAIAYAINRPADPKQPNTQLLNLCAELTEECAKAEDTAANPASAYLMHRFWRVCALPDPQTLEASRLAYIEREREEEYLRTHPPTPEQLAEQLAANIATHTGGWSYHDHECQCGRYFDDFPCPRGGHIWSCCGSTTHNSLCRNRKEEG